MVDENNKYTQMQKSQYDQEAKEWSVDNRNPVVGSFDLHNNWEDYDNFLFKDVDTSNKCSLDFGCGPGRNIVKFAKRFNRIDGADISEYNLNNAKIWCAQNNVPEPILYKNNGIDLSVIDSNKYDVIFSTICLQHICVYDIRFSFLKEFFRVLKPGGSLCCQMGYGTNHPCTVAYFDNNYDATVTNSGCDTRIESPDQIKSDLEKIGFVNFSHDIRPVGPGDVHSNWIFFRATKL